MRGVFTYRVNDAGLLDQPARLLEHGHDEVRPGGAISADCPAAAPSSSAAPAASGSPSPNSLPTSAPASSSTDATPTPSTDAVDRHRRRASRHPGSPADPAIADALIDWCIKRIRPHRHPGQLRGHRGAWPACRSSTSPSAQFRELLDAHLLTTFETCRAAAPKMVAQGSGAIVNTSSFAFLGDYGGTGYPAGKGGGQRADAGHRRRAQGHGVRANVVCPGAKTRLSTGPDYEAHIADLNRRGLLDDVSMQGALDAAPPEYAAPTYAYLASDRPRTSRAESSSPRAVSSASSPSDAERPRLPRPPGLAAVVGRRATRDDRQITPRGCTTRIVTWIRPQQF